MELRDIFLSHEPLLAFVVIGIGYLVGQIKICGFSIGIAGVLFVGLAFGAWQPAGSKPFSIARQVTELGLILFVYAIGLTSGPGFFASMRQRGVKFNMAVFLALSLGAVIAMAVGKMLALNTALIAGVYCGALTNTPALAAATQILQKTDPINISDPTLGYSVAYPFAIFTFILSFQLFTWLRKKELQEEIEILRKNLESETRLVVKHFEIRNPKLFNQPIGALCVQDVTGVIISRLKHGPNVVIPNKYTLLQEGDVVVTVGTQTNIEKALDYFGADSSEHIDINSDKIEMRRILVSNKKLVGKTIEQLQLSRRFNAQITRLRRADIDIVPTSNKVIELGDRLRVVMPTDKIAEVCKFFGDSERDIAELDFTAITMGISLGVLIGMVPIPLPGGSTVALGIAGGPLIVGLILGKLGKTGPLVWSIPLEANHAIRHIGLLLFLGGVGVNSGSHFAKTIANNGWQLLLLGVLVSVVTTFTMMLLLQKFARPGVIGTLGATSGMHTQPASLARAYELGRSDEVYVTYAITYPVAMIVKIILAQLILIIG